MEKDQDRGSGHGRPGRAGDPSDMDRRVAERHELVAEIRLRHLVCLLTLELTRPGHVADETPGHFTAAVGASGNGPSGGSKSNPKSFGFAQITAAERTRNT